MRTYLVALGVALLASAALPSTPLAAQSAPPAEASDAARVTFARETAMRAVNFKEGDAEALTRARADFTPEAWGAFIKWMGEFVDPKGTPKFTSSFEPSGAPIVVGQDNGITHLRIPGTLRQSQARGITTYRSVLDVEAGGTPLKIRHFEVSICSAKTDSPVTPCR